MGLVVRSEKHARRMIELDVQRLHDAFQIEAVVRDYPRVVFGDKAKPVVRAAFRRRIFRPRIDVETATILIRYLGAVSLIEQGRNDPAKRVIPKEWHS